MARFDLYNGRKGWWWYFFLIVAGSKDKSKADYDSMLEVIFEYVEAHDTAKNKDGNKWYLK